MQKVSSLIAIVLILCGCTKKLGPNESLQQFVYKSLNGQMSQSDLLELTTGDLHTALSALDETEVADYLKFEGANRESFQINLSNCENDTCYLTYTLKYERTENGEKTFDVELKKIAEMRKVEERWLLADVTDVKTYYQSAQPIEP